MRTALLPLKLRRKRRRCTRLDSNERLRSFNPPLLPPQLRVQDLELPVGFEPTISRLQGGCIGQLCYGSGRTPEYSSGQRTRIRGLDLGTVALFHLSYARKSFWQPRTDSSRGLRFWRPPCFQLHHGVAFWYTVPVPTRFLLLEREASCR